MDAKLKEIKQAYMDVFSSVKGKIVLDDILDQGFMWHSTGSENQVLMNLKEGRRQLALLIRDLALSPIEEEEQSDNSGQLKEN